MSVYIEYVILMNIAINYLLLSLTGIVLKHSPTRSRLVVSTLVATIGSVLYPLLPNGIMSILYKLILATLMIFIAYDPKKLRVFLRSFIILLLFTYALGGLLLAVGGSGVSMYSLSQNQCFILLVSTIYYALTKKLLLRYRKDTRKRSNIVPIAFVHGGKRIQTYGYIDSGNTLTDPSDNTAVVIVSPKIIYQLFDMQLSEIMQISKCDRLPQKHYISARTITDTRKILTVKVECVCVGEPQQAKTYNNVSCAMSHTDIGIDSCSALIGLTMSQ